MPDIGDAQKHQVANDKFQGLCLEGSDGSCWMNEYYDNFPPSARDRLKASQFNICAACIKDYREANNCTYEAAIDAFEAALAKPHGETNA